MKEKGSASSSYSSPPSCPSDLNLGCSPAGWRIGVNVSNNAQCTLRYLRLMLRYQGRKERNFHLICQSLGWNLLSAGDRIFVIIYFIVFFIHPFIEGICVQDPLCMNLKYKGTVCQREAWKPQLCGPEGKSHEHRSLCFTSKQWSAPCILLRVWEQEILTLLGFSGVGASSTDASISLAGIHVS